MQSIRESFWQLTDTTRMSEKYKIDENLKSLKYASLDTLKKIFIQYRFFTHYYITDLAILISKLPFGQLRSILADILDEELGEGIASHSHPTLYDDFLISIGIPKKALKIADPHCMQNLRDIQQSLVNKSWAYGVGLRGMGGECLCQIYLSTMHAFFSQNLNIIAMQDRIAWTFWDIHIGEVDLHHQKIVRAAIDDALVSDPDIVTDLTNGYLESKNAWDLFWQHIFNASKNKNINEVSYANI